MKSSNQIRSVGKTAITKEWFSAQVERIVAREKLPYMDAVIELCEKHDIEPAVGASYISKSIEQHIKQEAIELNFYRDDSKTLDGV